MKTLIVYSSKHGTTEKCALELSKLIDADLQNCDKSLETDFSQYNSIILGSSVYFGQIRKNMKKYINRNIKSIQSKKVGLFLCSGDNKNFDELFPYDLAKKAITGHFGSEILFSEMKFIERSIMKKMANTSEDVHAIDNNAIKVFSEKFI